MCGASHCTPCVVGLDAGPPTHPHTHPPLLQYIDANAIAGQLALPKQAKMTPKAFIHNIHQICKSDLQNIVLPEVGGCAGVLGSAC